MIKKLALTFSVCLIFIVIYFWKSFAALFGFEVDFNLETSKIVGTVERVVLILMWVKLIVKLDYAEFTGLHRRSVTNPFALLPPMGIMVLILFFKFLSPEGIKGYDLAIIAIFNLSVGLAEELLLRGIVFPFFIKKLGTSKWMIFLAALLSSVVFGLLHFINLMNPEGSLDDVLGQMITSVPVGFFFAALLLKVESIWAVGLLHGLVNIALGRSSLEPSYKVAENTSYETDWVPVLIFYTVFALIFLNGVLIIKKVDNHRVRRLLHIKQHATS